MEDAVARKVVALEHVLWISEFPSSLIFALLWPFYSGTTPTEYTHTVNTYYTGDCTTHGNIKFNLHVL